MENIYNMIDKLTEQKSTLKRQIGEYKEALEAEQDQELREYFSEIIEQKVITYSVVNRSLKRLVEAKENADKTIEKTAKELLALREIGSEKERFNERKQYKKGLF